MHNLIYGIITIVICVILYYLAYISYRKENYSYCIFLIVSAGFILRLYAGTDLFLHTWDESYHALVAKNFISHPLIPTLYDNPALPYNSNPQDWGNTHIWLHKQPLPMWIMALSMFAFGINEIALRLPTIILSSLAIFLTYRIFLHLFGRKEALLAAFFHSINGMIIEITAGRVPTDHVDLLFFFFIELSVFFVIKHLETEKGIYNTLTGITTGLAILCKWLPALIVI